MIFKWINYVILVMFMAFLLWGFFDNEDDLFRVHLKIPFM